MPISTARLLFAGLYTLCTSVASASETPSLYTSSRPTTFQIHALQVEGMPVLDPQKKVDERVLKERHSSPRSRGAADPAAPPARCRPSDECGEPCRESIRPGPLVSAAWADAGPAAAADVAGG